MVGGLFNTLLIEPFINVLMVFYNLFVAVGISGPLGWSIISMTLIIRGALHPLTKKQLDSAEKMNELKPKIDALKEKHKDDKQELQKAQMELYKKHGVNPAAGCLPLLLQFPILIALYRMFILILNNGNSAEAIESINKILYHPWLHIDSLDLNFLGANLASKPSQWQELGMWMLAVPVITTGLQWYQTKQMMPANKHELKPTKKGEKKQENFGAEMQKQMSFIMPIMIGFFSYSFPLGLSLYWNTYTVFALFTKKKKKIKNKSK